LGKHKPVKQEISEKEEKKENENEVVADDSVKKKPRSKDDVPKAIKMHKEDPFRGSALLSWQRRHPKSKGTVQERIAIMNAERAKLESEQNSPEPK